jgi:hypothetical protein
MQAAFVRFGSSESEALIRCIAALKAPSRAIAPLFASFFAALFKFGDMGTHLVRLRDPLVQLGP